MEKHVPRILEGLGLDDQPGFREDRDRDAGERLGVPYEGRVLCGRYRIVDALGEGGMASVWRGEQLATGMPVAVKIILRELLDTPGAIVRFQSEARAVAQLRSRHVVRLIDYDIDDHVGPFIVMELLEGETLGARLARRDAPAPAEFGRIFAQLARGLDHAHACGIVHRDLKPDNIFLARDDGETTAKLLDFGVAKVPLSRASGLTSAGQLVGTIAYMSPEQAIGKTPGPRSDLWSLGAVAYECLVGEPPFDADGKGSLGAVLLAICAGPLPVPTEVNPDVPPQLDAWFARACARDPDARFTSGAEMATALERICGRTSWPESAKERAAPRAPEVRPEGGYYVTRDGNTVGPVDLATLKRGILGGIVASDDLVWREGWADWQRISSFRKELASVRPAPSENLRAAPGLEAIGSRSIPPPGAPGVGASDAPSDPAASYYVTTGDQTVGPVTRELLLRGIEAGRVPNTALVWCEGWKRWRSAERVREWLGDEALAPGPRGPTLALENRPGLEAIGKPSSVPPSAPPSSAAADDCAPDAEVFYVFDGKTHVGPISGALLCRGVVVQCVPENAVVWRDGWDRWRPVAEVVWELAGLRMAHGASAPSDAGIRVLGSPSLVPPGAPSTPPSERA